MNEENKNKRFDLEDRLIEFTILVYEIIDNIENSRAGNHIADQIVRSCSNPALHYGEAEGAESRKDFIHKLKILLKELRETRAGLKIIKRNPLTKRIDLVEKALPECDELISIFVSSIKTARKNLEEEIKQKKKKDSEKE